MRRVGTFVLAALTSLALVGCGGTSSTAPITPSAAAITPSTAVVTGTVATAIVTGTVATAIVTGTAVVTGTAATAVVTVTATTAVVSTTNSPVATSPVSATVKVGNLTIKDAWVRSVTVSETMPMSDTMPMSATTTVSGTATPKPEGAEGSEGTGEGAGEAAAPTVTTGAYLTITNSGTTSDTLIKASAASTVATAVELHTMVDEGGVMQMRPVPQIEVPANGDVMLKVGGFHIMLIGVKQDLKVGTVVKLTLTFKNAGTVEVEAVVRAS